MAIGIFFTTKSPRKNVPDVGIKIGAACMPSGHAFDRITTPGSKICIVMFFLRVFILEIMCHTHTCHHGQTECSVERK